MAGILLLLVLLSPEQEPKKQEQAPEPAKKRVVERIVVQPRPLGPLAPPASAPAMIPGGLQNQKRITLELRQVDPPDGDVGAQVAQLARPINLKELAISSDNFDRWVFDDTRSDEGRKNHLGHLLTEKLHEVRSQGELEPEQLRKLRLAGDGDIKRYFDRVEASRGEFEAVRQDYTAGRLALVQLESLATDYQNGPFGRDSFFSKTLRKIRGDEKAAASGRK